MRSCSTKLSAQAAVAGELTIYKIKRGSANGSKQRTSTPLSFAPTTNASQGRVATTSLFDACRLASHADMTGGQSAPGHLTVPAAHGCSFAVKGLKHLCPTCLFAQASQGEEPDGDLIDFASAMKLLATMGATGVGTLVDSLYLFSACDRPAMHCSGQTFYSLDRAETLPGCEQLLRALSLKSVTSESSEDVFVSKVGSPLPIVGAVDASALPLSFGASAAAAPQPTRPVVASVPNETATAILQTAEIIPRITHIAGPLDLVSCVSLAPHLIEPLVLKYLGKAGHMTDDGGSVAANRRLLFRLVTVYVLLLQLAKLQPSELLNCLLKTVAVFPTVASLKSRLTSTAIPGSGADLDLRLLDVATNLQTAASKTVLSLLHSVSPDEQLRLFCSHKLDSEAPIAEGAEYDLWRSVAFYAHRKRRHDIIKCFTQLRLPYLTETIMPLLLNMQSDAQPTDSSTPAASASPSSAYSRVITPTEVHAVMVDIAYGLLERVETIDRSCSAGRPLSLADVFVLIRVGTVLGLLCDATRGSARLQAGHNRSHDDPHSYDSVITANQQKDFIARVKDLRLRPPATYNEGVRLLEGIVGLAFELPSIMMRWIMGHLTEIVNLVWRAVASMTAGTKKVSGSPKVDMTEKIDVGVVADPTSQCPPSEPKERIQTDTLIKTSAATMTGTPSTTSASVTLSAGGTLWWASADLLDRIDNPLPRKLLAEYAERLEEIADSAGESAAFAEAADSFRHIVRNISVLSSHEEIRQTALLFAVLGATDQLKALIHKELNQNVMMPSASIAILHDLVRRCPPNTQSYHILMSALTDLLVPPSASRSRWDDYLVMRGLVRSERQIGRLDEGTQRALLRWTTTNATKSIFFSLVSVRMVVLGLLFAGYYSGNSLEGGLVRTRLRKATKARAGATSGATKDTSTAPLPGETLLVTKQEDADLQGFTIIIEASMYSSSPNDLLRDLAMGFRESLPAFWTGIFFLYPIYSPSVQRYLTRNVCNHSDTVVVLRLLKGASVLTPQSAEAIRKNFGAKCAVVFVGDREQLTEVEATAAQKVRCAVRKEVPVAAPHDQPAEVASVLPPITKGPLPIVKPRTTVTIPLLFGSSANLFLPATLMKALRTPLPFPVPQQVASGQARNN